MEEPEKDTLRSFSVMNNKGQVIANVSAKDLADKGMYADITDAMLFAQDYLLEDRNAKPASHGSIKITKNPADLYFRIVFDAAESYEAA